MLCFTVVLTSEGESMALITLLAVTRSQRLCVEKWCSHIAIKLGLRYLPLC